MASFQPERRRPGALDSPAAEVHDRALVLNPIAFAIPVFFGAIALELAVAKRRGVAAYRWFDAITDLSCGVGNQVVSALTKVVTLGAYAWVERRFGLFHMPLSSPWTWVFAVVAVDFFYYWWHRESHWVGALWAAHVVHHQSEDYNLAVALRQAWFTGFTGLPFYFPLALVGLPVEAFAASIAISLVYQFWIHTELIGKLGWFELVFNTPSHHRVHHATNPVYLDKNHAGIFIVWDRMFGSFALETEPCVYGTTKPFGSFDPVWANFHEWAVLARTAAGAKGIWRKLLVFVMPPGWDPSTGRRDLPPFAPREVFVKQAPPPVSRGLVRYVTVSFAIVSILVAWLLLGADSAPMGAVWLLSVSIVAGTAAWGGLIERRAWAPWLEGARLAASLAAVAWLVALRA